MKNICLGIDVGGTTVKMGIFEIEGQLIDKWEVPTRKEEQGRYILEDAAKSIQEKMNEQNISNEAIVGCGIGVPGPVMPDGYVEVCVNLGWHDCYPAKELTNLLGGIPVCCANDANVAALGEMWQGGGKGYKDLVMITLGTGVGGGVILNEKVLSGQHGLAGEIGHICVRVDEEELCNCGGKGCLEQVASATGIVREARRTIEKTDIPSVLRKSVLTITAKDVLDAAKCGDELASKVMETMGFYLGQVMAQVTMIMDPERFVIGGGVSKAGDYLIDIVEKYYIKYTALTKKKASIGLAELGNDAGIYGAARLILD